jgi:hypothetical protein
MSSAKFKLIMDKFRFTAFVTIILLFISPFSLHSQDVNSISGEVSNAIRRGNAAEIARYFGPNVELTLPGSEGTFSRQQSEIILRNFFSRNTPTAFTADHQGSSRDGSMYVIGSLQTRAGKNYRVYYYIKKVGQSFLLHQVQFELQ